MRQRKFKKIKLLCDCFQPSDVYLQEKKITLLPALYASTLVVDLVM